MMANRNAAPAALRMPAGRTGRVLLALSPYLATMFLLCLFLGFVSPTGLSAKDPESDPSEALRKRIEAGKISGKIACRKGLMCGSDVLGEFYSRRSFLPAWHSGAKLLPHGEALLNAIRNSHREGLNPKDYHLETIEGILSKEERTPQDIVDSDLLLTDAFLLYGADLLSGRVDPEKILVQWDIRTQVYIDLAGVLEDALNRVGIEESLRKLMPLYAGYAGLRDALEKYRGIAARGGWPTIPKGPSLKPGDRSDRVGMVRQRLTVSDDLSNETTGETDFFDGALEQAVRRFQTRHVLKADGVIGPQTLRALNVTVEERIRQIEVNMERWRWLPGNLGERYVLVNIANFVLQVVDGGRVVMGMPIIVGKAAQGTPVFSNRIKYVVFNPYWNIPRSIAVGEMLPKIRRDPGYLDKRGIGVISRAGGKTRKIDPRSINWSEIDRQNFRFEFRQDPGPSNALGRIKFFFPNKYSVYLHDTPERHLFEETRRSFSHGCIRIEKPVDLAEYLLQREGDWDRARILSGIETEKTRTITLREPVNIYILYWTAWVGGDGLIRFGPDIYTRDKKLARALSE